METLTENPSSLVPSSLAPSRLAPSSLVPSSLAPSRLVPSSLASDSLVYVKDDEDDLSLPPNERPGKWYIVHTLSGAEKRVQRNLEELIGDQEITEAKLYEVVVPMEEVMEVRYNKKIVSSRKLFPGYVFLRCDLHDDFWSVVRETPGVVGFVGQTKPSDSPLPLPPKEVDQFLKQPEGKENVHRSRPRLMYELGDPVRVKEGPFADFTGEIIEINEDHLKVKVLVNIFGRETPVELEFSQVAKM